jgi:hypothetical protein
MIMPAWLLLLWSGLAAAIAAAFVAFSIGGVSVASWSLAPRPRSRSHGAVWFLAAGLFVYPLGYGIAFELLHRADLRIGVLLGALHGAFMFAVTRRRGTTRAALRAAAAHLAYGAVMAFLYITP